MSAADLAKLLFLSAIRGGSLLFLYMTVPEVGPLMTAMLRTALAGAGAGAGVTLWLFASAGSVSMNSRADIKSCALIGLFSGTLPFPCFSFVALHLPAAYCAMLNALAPLFGILFPVVWLAEPLAAWKLPGLLPDLASVAILVSAGALPLTTVFMAIGSMLVAMGTMLSSTHSLWRGPSAANA